MNGFKYGELAPLERCPYCKNEECQAEWTDIGVGYVQTGPFVCENCNAVEIGPYDKKTYSEEESKVGWYKPCA